ncbi:hypothetical protein L2E82_32049 [Cichorium intybus]|uniref:Uncharacterized protein n=1 Tax=Cichorium intybus TaxID=13427 RepID=A0ACB9BGY9_CICIN|nr:hypothetical protein L2E82_32049 [Cichorium intybus]
MSLLPKLIAPGFVLKPNIQSRVYNSFLSLDSLINGVYGLICKDKAVDFLVSTWCLGIGLGDMDGWNGNYTVCLLPAGQLLVICIPPPYGADSAWHGANLLSNSEQTTGEADMGNERNRGSAKRRSDGDTRIICERGEAVGVGHCWVQSHKGCHVSLGHWVD